MVMLGTYPGGGSSKYDGDGSPELLSRYSEVSDLGVDASSLLKTAGSLISGSGKSKTGGTAQAVPGGFDPQAILANEEKLRQQGLKTCLSIIKDANGNVIGLSPRQMPLNDPCPAGMVEATTFATGGGMAGGAAALTPAAQQSYVPPAQPSPESTMTYPSPESTPWYKKWWVWTLILGGTATVGVGGYLIYRKSQAAPAAAGLGTFRSRGCRCGRR